MLKLQTISDFNKSDKSIKQKIKYFSNNYKLQPIFILIKPDLDNFTNTIKKELYEIKIKNLIKSGLINLEISWTNNKNWLDYVSKIKLKFPEINLGSASIVNKKSIDDSIKIGTAYSMMRFWDKDLLNYAKTKKHLLIPGIKNIKDLKEAITLDCKIVKIYPVKNKDKLIKISQYQNIDFIAAGGLSISDLDLYKSLGYKAIIIGDKAFKNSKIDPKIYEWLKKTELK